MIASGISKSITAAGAVLVTVLLASAAAAGPVTVTRVAAPERALRFEVTVPASLDEVWTMRPT